MLDVSTNATTKSPGVHPPRNGPQHGSSFSVDFLRGCQAAGLATCGKHFPAHRNLELLGNEADVPVTAESFEQLNPSALIPFRTTIAQGLDAIMVCDMAVKSNGMKFLYACLSEQVVQGFLRSEMSFDGVVVSDCLDMEALTHNIGIGAGTIRAVEAGCDTILLCCSYTAQQEAITGLMSEVENGLVDRSRIQQSLRRVLEMKSKWTSWEKALNPAGISGLTLLQPSHRKLSTAAYDGSITVVRDQNQLLPLSQRLGGEEDVLLLTPIVKPLPASAAYRVLSEEQNGTTAEKISGWNDESLVMTGERVFRELGRAMSRQGSGRVLHTSYTANGLRPIHEELIDRAGAVVVITADVGRNRYQTGFTKHVSMICRMAGSTTGDRKGKPCVVVSVSSPYDFAFDPSIETYICTYDFTENALQALVRVIYGAFTPTGVLPGSMNGSQILQRSRQHWLVENWNEDRDSYPLEVLLKTASEHQQSGRPSIFTGVSSKTFLLRCGDIEEAHFVVRNGHSRELYGFCSTYYFRSTGVGTIGAIIVDPSKRKLSIGHSLHNRAMCGLIQKKEIKEIKVGSRVPSVFLGFPTANAAELKRLKQWLAGMGWHQATCQLLSCMILRDLPMWSPPDGLSHTMSHPDIKFDLVYGMDYAETILDHVKRSSTTGILEIYQLALADKVSCGVIRAKRPEDGSILGSLVLYKNDSKLARFVPALGDSRVLAGGISSPVISPSVSEAASLMQGLILLGIRQIKKQGASEVVLDCVSALTFSHSFLGRAD